MITPKTLPAALPALALLCARAGEAYRDALELTGPAPEVAVIRIGDRYVVTRPRGHSTIGELSSAAVLDESMRVLGVFRR